MLFKITRSLLTLSPSKSRVPELTPSISSFFYQYWCCLWYEAKVWCRDSLKFLSSFCIFQLFWDRNCCISWTQTNLLSWSGGPGSRLFSLQAVEHLDRGIKYPDIPMHMATWTSTHHFLTETNVMCSQLRIAYTHERWGIHFLSHDGETRGTHTNPTLHPVPTGSLEALTLWLSFPALTCKTSNHKQHEKGDCRGEGDLFIFLLEDLKRLSYLSYLGCCWKDTEIIREGTDKESKQLLVAA